MKNALIKLERKQHADDESTWYLVGYYADGDEMVWGNYRMTKPGSRRMLTVYANRMNFRIVGNVAEPKN
ncbi:hypothetical protein [Burkholderia ubonensis]|uniref:Uncharacterized protein n=1 Tax=Burkholderia ubonensis TaxID=101571 RepID=A0ABD4DZG5_9BURK|nr:hypothetical protein [Burkholderia ubonensis]KVN83508.1 hypothetical protein WJ68_16485 [Burkholderia ubonensis]